MREALREAEGRGAARAGDAAGPGAEPAQDPVASWLNVLMGMLRVPARQARAIRDELEAHLRDRIDDLLLSGRGEAEAARVAIAELGEAAALAARFRDVNTSSRRRRIMNVSVLMLAGGAAVMSLVALNQGGRPAPFAEYAASAAPAEPADDLSGVRVTVEVRERPLEEVFEMLGQAAGRPVHIHWPSLESVWIQRDTPVTLSVREGTFERVFGLLAEQVADDDQSRPDYRATDGTIWIATRNHIDLTEMRLVSYDLTPVVEGIREADGDDRPSLELIGEIKRTLMALVGPAGWVENGGNTATMTSVGRRLFVKAPPRYHEQIRWILGQLPSAQSEVGTMLRLEPVFRPTEGDPTRLHVGFKHTLTPEGGDGAGEGGGE